MSVENPSDVKFEIGHVLFIDIVGYSKLHLDEQRRMVEMLNRVIRETREFQIADTGGKLVRLPTGDGMALVFYNAPEAPAECALEIARALKEKPELLVRMGIHSGPVSSVLDVNERRNIAGAGINTAQRVMACGDAGHILLSKRAAEDLAHSGNWQQYLHELGDCEVKHGAVISVVNLCTDDAGNRELPSKLKQAREHQAALAHAKVVRERKKIAILAAACVAVSLGAAIWFVMRSSASNLVGKGIAVLPFENLSEDKENAYLANGVQDEILTDLTKVADLKVISRRSVAQFRDTKQTMRQIGEALGVAHVLEGTVRKVAGRIHVTAQLIDARTETETWGEKYDRDIADVFQIQSDISQAIVTQLKAALSPAEKAAIEEKPTQDKEAYDLYLRARSLVYGQFGAMGVRMEENATKAVPLLEAAIARDPKFMLAYCVLGDAQLVLNDFSGTALDKGCLVKAKQAIDAALRISPNSAEAHLILARYFIHGLEDASAGEKEAGEKELSIASAGLPGRVDVFNLRADVETQHGKWKEALRDREKAAELDPRDSDTAYNLADIYMSLRKYGDAERVLDHAIATTPQQSTGPFWRQKSRIALAKGDAKAAMAALDSSPTRNSGLSGMNLLVAELLVMERSYTKAEEILQSLEETAKAHNILPKAGFYPFFRGAALIQLGRIAHFRGDKEKARGYFEAARPAFEESLARHPEVGINLGCIAEIDAALGRKEDAIREGRKAVELGRNQDAGSAPLTATSLAIVYVWTGERDAVLQQLAEVAKLPGGGWSGSLTAGDLKLNPIWDELRNDPRFDKIIAEAAKPIKLD